MAKTKPKPDEITGFLHCQLCLDCAPDGVSPRDWAQFEVALTPQELQVWCWRHDLKLYSVRRKPDE